MTTRNRTAEMGLWDAVVDALTDADPFPYAKLSRYDDIHDLVVSSGDDYCPGVLSIPKEVYDGLMVAIGGVEEPDHRGNGRFYVYPVRTKGE